jgi:hypothetical protein
MSTTYPKLSEVVKLLADAGVNFSVHVKTRDGSTRYTSDNLWIAYVQAAMPSPELFDRKGWPDNTVYQKTPGYIETIALLD